jgi:hypothetical protein
VYCVNHPGFATPPKEGNSKIDSIVFQFLRFGFAAQKTFDPFPSLCQCRHDPDDPFSTMM